MINARSDNSHQVEKLILFRQVTVLPLCILLAPAPVGDARSAETQYQIKSKDVFHFRFIGVYLQPLAQHSH